ncbi:hypothetical protein ABT120_45630 [Nonomuraea angiospora]|uniref:hypothetical protein n=1 Tax=Nonomuraea angiospora TaxID=46172 RepID=UPI003318BA2F
MAPFRQARLPGSGAGVDRHLVDGDPPLSRDVLRPQRLHSVDLQAGRWSTTISCTRAVTWRRSSSTRSTRAALVGLGVGLVASAVFIGAFVGDEDNPGNPVLTLSMLVSFPLGAGLSWLTRLPLWRLVAMAGDLCG